MQNSIWKIVAAVGIIGIGTLVVLEVQHRLPQMQNAMPMAGLPEGAEDFEGLQSTNSENFYTPDGSTDFDRLISGETGTDTGLQLSEPGGDAAAFTEAAPNVPPGRGVDTTVRRSAMYEGESPFQPAEQASAGAEVAGLANTAGAQLASSEAGSDNEVRTVSYQQRQRFGDDEPFGPSNAPAGSPAASETPRFPALDLDAGQAGAAGSAEESRGTFGDDTFSDDSGSPFGDDLSAPSNGNGTSGRTGQPRPDENIMFFGAGGNDAQTTPAVGGNLRPTPGNDNLADQPFTLDAPIDLPAGRPVSGDANPFGDDPFGGAGGAASPAGSNPADSETVLPLFGVDPADRVNADTNNGSRGNALERNPSPPASGGQAFPDQAFPDTEMEPFGSANDNESGSSFGGEPRGGLRGNDSASDQSGRGAGFGLENPSQQPSQRLPERGQPNIGDVEDIPFFTEDPEPADVDPLFPQPGRQPAARQPEARQFESDPRLRLPNGSGSMDRTVPGRSDFGNSPGIDSSPGFDGSPGFGRGDAPGDFGGNAGNRNNSDADFGGSGFGSGLPDRLPAIDRRPSGNLPTDLDEEFPPLPNLPGDRNPSGGRDFSGGANNGAGSGLSRPSTDPFDNSRSLDTDPRLDRRDRLDSSGGNRLDLPAPRDRSGSGAGLSAAMPASASEIMRPHVTLRKDAPETASVGVPLEYVITVANEGQSTAYEVTVEDEVARGVDLQNTNPVADFDRTTRRLQWRFAELQPNEKQQIRISVTPTGEGTLDSTASVRFKAQVKASTVITAPRLSLQLTGPTEVKLGDEVNFRYLVRNDGTGMATDVLLRSVLPAGLKHSEGNDLEYEINTLAANEEREIVLTVVAVEPGAFRNAAEITSAGVAAAADETTITIVGSQLKVERLGPERRYVGRPAQFQNIVSNETNFEATDCVVLEQVPDGMKFVSAPGAQYNPQDRVITWRIDRLAPGKQVVLDVELTAETPGQVDTIVEVVENAGFRTRATKTVAVEDIHNVSADISRLDGPVAVGEKFTFSITVDNRGTAGANEVQLSILVPKEIEVLAAGSKENGIKAGFNSRTNSVVFEPILLVEPGQIRTFQLMLQGQQPVRNALVKAQLKYAEMQDPLVVSESVTIFSDSL